MLKLIIAEDEQITCENIVACIDWKRNGFEIQGIANNGEDAYKKIVTLTPDIVLLDIRMPIMSGLDVIRKVRMENCTSPEFIIISGYDEFSYAQSALNLRAAGYLLKPFSPDELLNMLFRTIMGEEPTGESASTSYSDRDFQCQDLNEIYYPYEEEERVIENLKENNRSRIEKSCRKFIEVCTTNNTDTLSAAICSAILQRTIKRALRKTNEGNRQKLIHDSTDMFNIAWNELAGIKGETVEKTENLPIMIENVKEYIEKNYREKLMLQNIAETVHLSPAYLSSIFSKYTGYTISAYIQKIRIEYARCLLGDLSYSIAEVAESVGYPDTKYFATVFKQTCGISPLAYRQRKHK